MVARMVGKYAMVAMVAVPSNLLLDGSKVDTVASLRQHRCVAGAKVLVVVAVLLQLEGTADVMLRWLRCLRLLQIRMKALGTRALVTRVNLCAFSKVEWDCSATIVN